LKVASIPPFWDNQPLNYSIIYADSKSGKHLKTLVKMDCDVQTVRSETVAGAAVKL
jgi:hypothetical protein